MDHLKNPLPPHSSQKSYRFLLPRRIIYDCQHTSVLLEVSSSNRRSSPTNLLNKSALWSLTEQDEMYAMNETTTQRVPNLILSVASD
jgi:hypothetical protein